MEKLTKSEKIKSLEQQSNITLISTSVAIISFFILLYAQNLVKTNYLKSHTFLLITDITFAVLTLGIAAIAYFKKKSWLWEYVIFGGVVTIGYYFLLNPGISGLPFLYSETGNTLKVSPFVLKIAQIFNTNYVIYGLWAVNVIYCILAIFLHTVKYNKIKNSRVQK